MSTTPENTRPDERELFWQALEIEDAGERRAFVHEQCGEDADLRESLEELLENHERDDGLLDSSNYDILETERDSLACEMRAQDHLLNALGHGIDTIGDYELLEELGRGAMGVVFRARQRSLDREVAIKVILGSALASPAERERFRLEARAAASLEHSHIVPIYEVGHEDDYDYYSMALVVGGTLGARMGEEQFDRRDAVKLVIKMAQAIKAAHRQGIIHRDLKPDNILLDEKGEPHVSDFGLACRLEQESTLTLSGQIMGTPQYMAPEQADTASAPITTAADQYSLGTILYELLAGVPTFRGDSILQTLRMVATAAPKPLHQHDSSIDRDLETIVLRTLEKKPADRYESLGAFADDLEAWLEFRPIAARPPTMRERIFKWMRRRPVHAALVATAVLLLLTLGVGGPITAVRQARLHEQAAAASREAVQQSAQNRLLAYTASMNLAGVAMYDHTMFPTIQHKLEEWRPKEQESQDDLRGWEWFYLASFADQSAHSIHPKGEAIQGLELAPSGKIFTCFSANSKSFEIRETATGRLVKTIPAHQQRLVAVTWSPDGNHLATASRDGTVAVWSANSGKLEKQTRLSSSTPTGVSWRPDGAEILVSTAENHLHRLDASTLESVGVIETRVVKILARFFDGPGLVSWSPDSKAFVVAGVPQNFNDMVWLYRMDSLDGPAVRIKEHKGAVTDIAWSPDGSLFASAGWDGLIKIWNSDGEPVRVLQGHTGKIQGIARRPDGAALVSATKNRELFVWDVRSGEIIDKLPGHTKAISVVDWSSDGKFIVTGDEEGGVKIWETGRNRVAQVLYQVPAPIQSLRTSPDGKTFLCGLTQKKIQFVDVSTGEAPEALKDEFDHTWIMDWSADGKHIVVATVGASRERERLSGFSLLRIDGLSRMAGHPPIRIEGPSPIGLAWEPGGHRVATCSYGGYMGIWDTETKAMVHELSAESTPPLWAVSWSPDAKYLVATGMKHRRMLFDSEGTLIYHARSSGDGELLHSAQSWSPDSLRYAAPSTNGQVLIYSVEGPEPVAALIGHSSEVKAVAWHPGGKRLASAGDDHTVRIWDTDSGQLLLTLRGHTESIHCLEWIHGGQALASAGLDGSIRVWNAAKGYQAERSGDPAGP